MTIHNGKQTYISKDAAPQVDIIQKCIGVLGKWHIWVCFMLFLVKFPVAWHQISIVFLAPPTSYTCIMNHTDKCSTNCTTYVFDTSIFSSTIITEWELVCQKHHLANLAQTVTMVGVLFGNMIFGFLSDKFGRKTPLVLAGVLQGVAGLGAAFSPWFIGFMIMRFLAAVATGGTMITSFVLVMELVGTEWRTVVGILYQIPFNLGHLLLPLFSYYLREWRHFQVAISAPSLALVVYYWLLPESPRWQLTAGKKEAAINTLKKAAKRNKMPVETIEKDVDEYLQTTKGLEQSKGNIVDLVRTPIIRMYTLVLCFNWLVCGLCFFGVSQFIGQLGGNIFINVALTSAIQFPSTLFACWSTKAWGRKKTLIVGNMLSGISLLLISVVPANPPWIHSVFSAGGMCGLALSFPTVYIYSGELFPTVVRNIGVGTSSMCARIGSMVAPFVATLNVVEPWIPPLIFGLIPLIAAGLCYKLPETLDCKLPDTIEEAEDFERSKYAENKNNVEMS